MFAANSSRDPWAGAIEMGKETDGRLIADSVLGAELDESEIGVLGDLMEVRKLSNGDVLVREGDTDHALHLLAGGKLDVTRVGAGSEEIHLHTMQQGELAGAMGFVDGIPRNATLRARSEALVYSLEREAFESLMDEHPRLVYHIMRAVTRNAHNAMLELSSQIGELTNYIVKQHGRY